MNIPLRSRRKTPLLEQMILELESSNPREGVSVAQMAAEPVCS